MDQFFEIHKKTKLIQTEIHTLDLPILDKEIQFVAKIKLPKKKAQAKVTSEIWQNLLNF